MLNPITTKTITKTLRYQEEAFYIRRPSQHYLEVSIKSQQLKSIFIFGKDLSLSQHLETFTNAMKFYINTFYKIGFILLLLSIHTPLIYAQKQRPKVGLVLSGGGAKGVAHVGALKVIEQVGIPIDYICGTSMGAIVGGLYSIGYNAEELDSIIRAQDWMFLFSDKIDRSHRSFRSKMQNDLFLLSLPLNRKIKIASPTGIMKGQSILNKFSDLTIGYHDMDSFNDLPIPFSCVAADLVSGKEIVMRNGNLPLAMRASMSVPGFFEPVPKDSMIMIDGGVLNNFPVDVVKEMGADIVIGIDLSTTNYEAPKYKSLLDIANRIAFLFLHSFV